MSDSFYEQSKFIYEEYVKRKEKEGDVSAICYLCMNPIDPKDANYPNELDFYYLIENEKFNHMRVSVGADFSIGRNYF
jgi:hypothetical protein